MTTPVFFDVEASALKDGYAIEIGWAWRRDGQVRSEGHLIRPTLSWLKSKRWDPAAERLHGISLERLQAEGMTCREVGAQMNESLAGQVLISDNSEHDGRRLSQVLEIAGAAPTFNISDVSTDALIAAAADKFAFSISSTHGSSRKHHAWRLEPIGALCVMLPDGADFSNLCSTPYCWLDS